MLSRALNEYRGYLRLDRNLRGDRPSGHHPAADHAVLPHKGRGRIDCVRFESDLCPMSRDDVRESESWETCAGVRRSARVSTVARILDCDESQIRRLIRAGTLEAHRIGKRGLRVFLDSVVAYQEARAEPSRLDRQMSRQKRVAARSSHLAALAKLRARGLLD